jgi:hypothetical protein
MGAVDLSEIRRRTCREGTLRRRPVRPRKRRHGREACEGTCEDAGPRRGRAETSSEGETPEGSDRVHVRRCGQRMGSIGQASRRIPPCVPQSAGSGYFCGKRPAHPGDRVRPSSNESSIRRWNPRTAAVRRHRRPHRQAREGGARRGGDKPRGRDGSGEASPVDANLTAHVVEGAMNPRRGTPGRQARVVIAVEALRGAQACGSGPRRRVRTGRSAEDLAVVETTRRER